MEENRRSLSRPAAQAEAALQEALNRALRQRQFFICLQPKFSLPERGIAGAEALLRWNDPENGIRFPGEFLEAAERNGYLETLDLYALEEACRCIRDWLDTGRAAVPVSVNLSKASLYAAGFPDAAWDCIRRYGLPPSSIEFEFSAAQVEQHPVALSRAINQLHALHCGCVIDGFAQGTQMLEHVLAFEVDAVKFNCRAFPRENRQAGIAACLEVIAAARRLNIALICEGVEAQEQLQALAAAGCRLVQGFALSMPVTTQMFTKMMDAGATGANER